MTREAVNYFWCRFVPSDSRVASCGTSGMDMSLATKDDDDEEWLDPKDTSYCPDEASGGDMSFNIVEEPEVGTAEEPKYVVFESCLKQLLQRCPQCSAPDCEVSLSCIGTMVKATISCPNSHITKCPTQLLRMFSFMGIRTIQKTQFFKFQRCYMLPAVTEVWQLEQSQLLQQLKGRELCLAGDVTEVSSSNRMEREGLERALTFLNQQDVSISMLVTDRHTEVKAFMKRTYPTIRHRFDVWHVAKGIKKKLVAAAAGKRHNVIQKWCPTIVRHLYWCARSSNDDGALVLAKWRTILRHVLDIHEHPDSLHPKCAHSDLGERLWLDEAAAALHYKCVELYIAF
ncbi:uncharacterized protein LOC135389560 [Ornithodoros turicata]|uniref:uncharacterized protein LOC135389560 n=1 Tax=Ornithodoros turicata TaxID=34597 RepID=UPI00313993C2